MAAAMASKHMRLLQARLAGAKIMIASATAEEKAATAKRQADAIAVLLKDMKLTEEVAAEAIQKANEVGFPPQDMERVMEAAMSFGAAKRREGSIYHPQIIASRPTSGRCCSTRRPRRKIV